MTRLNIQAVSLLSIQRVIDAFHDLIRVCESQTCRRRSAPFAAARFPGEKSGGIAGKMCAIARNAAGDRAPGAVPGEIIGVACAGMFFGCRAVPSGDVPDAACRPYASESARDAATPCSDPHDA